MAILVHFDGLCEPNPGGVCTYGFTVDRKGVRELGEYGVVDGSGTPKATNNRAEWTGLLRALERLDELGWTKQPVVVKGDSQLVIRQVTGEYKVRNRDLKPFAEQVALLRMKFRNLKLQWVPREENGDADALCWRAHAEETGR